MNKPLRRLVCAVALLLSQVFHVSYAVAADLSGNEKFQQGMVYFNDAEYAKALAAFDPLAPALKASGEFNYYYALSLLNTEQSEQALVVMKQAIALAPANADYRYALGLIYAQRMSELSLLGAITTLGPAKATLVKAVELNPQHVGATAALIEFLLDVPGGDKEQAQELLEKLLTLDPAAATALQAKVARSSGNNARAEQLLLQAVETPGSSAAVRLKLAKFYVDQQQYAKAIPYGLAYLSLPKRWSDFPRDTTYAHVWLAIAYHAVGDGVNFQQHASAVDTSAMPERVVEEIEDSYAKAGITHNKRNTK
jgi:tetratricopeptide (TPR) repeat protein